MAMGGIDCLEFSIFISRMAPLRRDFIESIWCSSAILGDCFIACFVKLSFLVIRVARLLRYY